MRAHEQTIYGNTRHTTHWKTITESDAFKLRIELKDKPCTRKGILATISSIFDPLGLIASVILIGMSLSMENFSLNGKGGDIRYHYLSSWASQGTSSHLILED